MSHLNQKRTGISLLEVLISIGVIALGIFGVATLIPVAQFKVAEGTALDRIAAFGPSAAAEFRIRNMGSPNNWVVSPFANIKIAASTPGESSDNAGVLSKGFVIDPLGVIQGRQLFFPSPPAGVQPSNALQQMPWLMPRLNLTNTFTSNPLVNERLAQKIFYLGDDVDFDRPDEQEKQPRRQYFIDSSTGQPVSTVPGAQLSWFATLSPAATPGLVTSDEFVLSIVICKGRTPESQFIGQTEHDVAVQPTNFPGEIVVANDPLVSELKSGDWILVAKSNAPNSATNWVYRWTQVIGTSDEDTDKVTGERTFSISNDDIIIGPNETGRVFFVTGVESIFERTIRIQNTNAWDEQSF